MPAVTHGSSLLLARRLGVSAATVARAWQAHRVQPRRAESFPYSINPIDAHAFTPWERPRR